MQFFKTFKIGQLIKKFNKTCDTVEARPVIIPDKIMNNYDSWKEYQYLTSNEIKNVLNESINFYLNKFNELVIEILSFNFFDDFLTFYEYYSQAREKKGILLNNNAQRIRFIRIILEEAVQLKLSTSKKLSRNNFNIIDDLYSTFIAISLISNKLSTNIILDIQSASIELNNSHAELKNSSAHDSNLKIAHDFISQCASQRYLNKNYSSKFFEMLALIGLEEKDFYSKISIIFKGVYRTGKLPLDEFKKVISEQGEIFKYLMEGMILEKEQLENIVERIRRPYNTSRQLSHPFLIWQIDNTEYVIIENRSFIDSLQYIIGDFLPYDKVPKPWKKFFSKTIINELRQGIDFENFIESILKNSDLNFIREIKIPYQNNHLEPDFVIYEKENNTLIFFECKNLIKGSDPNSWKLDYSKFLTSGERPFNETADKILEIINIDNSIIVNRFKKEQGIEIINPSYKYIFVVNSPTLYMFASKYLIVTWKMFYDMIKFKNFSGDMTFENDEYFIYQNIRFFRPGEYPKQLINKKTGGGLIVQ